METELWRGYSGTARRKGRQQTNRTYCHRATSLLYKTVRQRGNSYIGQFQSFDESELIRPVPREYSVLPMWKSHRARYWMRLA